MKTLKNLWIAVFLLLLVMNPAYATRMNIEAGDGLVFIKSAKAMKKTKYLVRVQNLFGYKKFGAPYQDSRTDIWSYWEVSYKFMKDFEFLTTAVAHAEYWYFSPGTPRYYWQDPPGGDRSLANSGDFLVGLKFPVSLGEGADIAFEPLFSIPAPGSTRRIIDTPSQTGGADFGMKFLMDLNFPPNFFYINSGFIRRAKQKEQIPLAIGYEATGLKGMPVSFFLEWTGNFRPGVKEEDRGNDSAMIFWNREDWNAMRLSPGLKWSPSRKLTIDLGGVIGFNPSTPSWQVYFGLTVPSTMEVQPRKRLPKRVPQGTIAGKVTDKETGRPLRANVSIPGSKIAGVSTDKITGTYSMIVPPGEYVLHAEAEKYKWQEQKITVKDKGVYTYNFALTEKSIPIGTLTGRIIDALKGGALLAKISFLGTTIPEISSDAAGAFSAKLTPGKYNIAVKAGEGYIPQTASFEIKEKGTTTLNFALVKRSEKVIIRGINLVGREAVVTPDAYDMLNKIGSLMEQVKDMRLEIGGHTEARGRIELRIRNSKLLADAAKNYLLQRFKLTSERIFVNAYGSTVPITTNKTPQGRAQNRRVELLLLAPEEKVPVVPTPTVEIPTTTTPTATTPTTPTTTTTTQPTSAELSQKYYREGIEYYFNDQYEEAIAAFQRALKADPNNSKARDYLNKAQAKLKKIKG